VKVVILSSDPISGVSFVQKNENCPANFEELVLGKWRGTNMGCKFENKLFIAGTFRICAEYNGETK